MVREAGVVFPVLGAEAGPRGPVESNLREPIQVKG